MNIVDMLSFWARSRPQHLAIIQPDLKLNFQQFASAIEAAAEQFSRSGLEPGKPVAVAHSNPAKMLVAILGLFRAGFSVVPVNKGLLEYLPSVGVTAMVGERGGIVFDGGTNLLFEDRWLSVPISHKMSFRERKSPNVNLIVFTSGTTGKPKPIAHPQAAWERRIQFSSTTTFANFERALVAPGLTTIFGFNRACEVLYGGKTACFALFGLPMLWLVNNYNIDMMIASPQQALSLAELQEKNTHYNLSSLKALRVAGALVAPEGIQRLKQNLCRNIIVSYASTEAGPTAVAIHDMIAHIPSAVGFVAPGAEVEIVDQHGAALQIGTEGFIRLRTPQFIAMWEAANPGSPFDPRNTWFYPGDLGWLTEDGVLCVAGRRGDVINRGGMKVSSAEFEEFLISRKGVRDAGVCSVMGESGREEAWIAVVFDPGIDLAEFRTEIESNERFRGNIDKLFVVEEIPRGDIGKIQRRLLEEMLRAINEETHAVP